MSAVIETDRLTKRYGEARGIEDLSLSVEAGEVFGFLGPNGAGKTTTIRRLGGKARRSGGAIRSVTAFKYYGSGLTKGIDPAAFIGLTLSGAALAFAGSLLFERRDVLA